MRCILVEAARRRHRLKRGGDRGRVELDDAQPAAPETDDDLLALDEALKKLVEKDPVKAELVQLRIFAGQTMGAAADLLGLSLRSTHRLWAYAKAWLLEELGRD